MRDELWGHYCLSLRQRPVTQVSALLSLCHWIHWLPDGGCCHTTGVLQHQACLLQRCAEKKKKSTPAVGSLYEFTNIKSKSVRHFYLYKEHNHLHNHFTGLYLWGAFLWSTELPEYKPSSVSDHRRCFQSLTFPTNILLKVRNNPSWLGQLKWCFFCRFQGSKHTHPTYTSH